MAQNPDLNILCNQLLSLGKTLLEKQGNLLPFGAQIDTDGKFALVAAESGPEHQDRPAPAMISLLTRRFSGQASSKKIKAAGICFDSRLRLEPSNDSIISDAIQCGLEDEHGEAANVFLPYQKFPSGEIIYGELIAARRPAQIWLNS